MTSRSAHGDAAMLPGDRALAVSRVRFLTAETVDPAKVRNPILASWRRSRNQQVLADHVEPLFLGDLGTEHPLARTAAPVLRDLFTALAGQPVSIVLTDQRGLVLTRLTGDSALEHKLDDVRLAPGFSYAEESVGTNGIGTAIEVGAPTQVFGHEHFAERLEGLACAGAPIRHPVTGRTVGVLDLTCWRRDAGSLLLTLATSTASQIQTALLNQSDAPQRALFSEYLRACHRSTGIVLAVSGQFQMVNDHARSTLAPADQAALLAHAAEGLVGRLGVREINLPGGTRVRMRSTLVGDPDAPAGVVVHVDPHPGEESVTAVPTRILQQLPGVVGRDPAWLRVCRQIEEVFLVGEWVAVVGEPATGKESLLRAVQLRRHPVPRLEVLDLAVGGQQTWPERLHSALDGGADSVVLQHVDGLPAAGIRTLSALLQQARQERRTPLPWVEATLASSERSDLRALMQLFPTTIEVPPLRLHMEDVPALAVHFLRKMGEGRMLMLSPQVLRILARSSWPGNAAQLQEVLRWVHAHRRSGVIEPSDLPPQMQAVSHRLLSQMEALERDAIVRALDDAQGNKDAAASFLGISRATIYRRIRTYGIVDLPV